MGKKAAQRKPWERLDKEGSTAFAAFEHYRRAGTSRSVKATAEAVGRSYFTVRRYSSRFCWAERAQAWDDRLIEAEDKAILNERARLAKEHLKTASLMRGLANTTMARTLKRAVADEEMVPTTMREANALARDGVTIERLVTDQATERTEAHIDTSKLEPGEAAELLELLKKAGHVG